MNRRNWSREETILAFSLYCKTPFGKINQSNPNIIELASIINRTSSAVAMKMCNFGRFDPELQNRNVSGLKNGGKMDEVIWNEFCQDGENLIAEVAAILAKYTNKPITAQVDLSDLPDIQEGREKERIVKSRLNQKFFRDTLLSSYHSECCITGINIPVLLIASHIKPWRVSTPQEKIKPSNGLLLNAFHDKAFDNGLISINNSFEIMISSKCSDIVSDTVCYEWITSFKGKKIVLPEKFIPEKQFLEYHNDVVFIN